MGTESDPELESKRKGRDDFTWLILLLESMRNRRVRVPLRTTEQQFNHRYRTNPYSQRYGFSDQRQEEEEEKRKRRLARQMNLAYVILMVVMLIILLTLAH